MSFLAPPGAEADYFASGLNTYYWFLLDSLEQNDGNLESLRFDAEYDISDDGFFKAVRVGGRWAERERVTRNTDFSTWGNLSAPWAGRAGCAPWNAGPNCPFVPGRYFTGLPGQEFAIAGGVFTDEYPEASQLRNPFGNNFQRGNAPSPLPGGTFFFGGDDFIGEYLAGTSKQQAQEINVLSQTPNPFFGVQGRSFTDIAGNVTACDPFCPPEVSDVVEVTNAAYARIDYGADFDNGWNLEGNFGVRYVETRVETGGLIGFPNPFFFDDPGASGGNGNGDGIVQVAELDAACGRVPPGQSVPGYCSLSDARKAEFAAGHTGDILLDDRSITFDHWLPSFNARLDVGGGLLFRFAVSKGISRPDLQLFRSGGGIGDNTNDLRADGTLESGPLFQLNTGNRNVRPVESWNYDASVEWYFDDVGSLTVSAFLKDIEGIVNNGFEIVEFIDSNNVAIDVEVNGPVNANGGTLKGVEIGYQQTYDFLPGLLDGLGSALTYTYVDGGEFTNANLDVNQGLF